ncbi:MAG: PQQ-binding-like beta-propeller repeat protein [Pyrinomonadaceae bacterium]
MPDLLQIGPQLSKTKILRLDLLVLLILFMVSPVVGQERAVVSTSGLPRLQWNKAPGVERYRLQIAADERFNDVIYDGVVYGQEYVARDLTPGRYYWRVLAADAITRRVLRNGKFEVKSINVERPEGSLVSGTAKRPYTSDWLAATGVISNLIAAQLREKGSDFIGTNSEGTVYAIDSAFGTPLWIARNRIGVRPTKMAAEHVRQVVPLIVTPKDGPNLVIVTSDGEVRALESTTGREVWLTALTENIVGGTAADLDGKPGPEIYLTGDKFNTLVCLDAKTGRVQYERRLNDKPIGPPVVLNTRTFRALLLPLQSNAIEVRSSAGEHLRFVKSGVPLTTQPVVEETSLGVLVLVGTKDGLVIFETNGFQPLGRIAVDRGEYPTGSLSVVDLDGDKSVDTVVMITNLGRVGAVELLDRKVRWFADGFVPGASPSFADLNGDGWLDVLVPANNNFAVGLSGIDGARIWESTASGQSSGTIRLPAYARRLATATLSNGRIIVAGNDPSAIGLRGLELQKSAARATAQ